MTAKVDNPEARRIQMTEQLRKSKRREVISKKRENLALNQILQEGAGYSEQEFYLPSQEDEYGYEYPSQQPEYTVNHFLINQSLSGLNPVIISLTLSGSLKFNSLHENFLVEIVHG